MAVVSLNNLLLGSSAHYECFEELFLSAFEDPGPGHVPVKPRRPPGEPSDLPNVAARLSSLALEPASLDFPPS